MSSEKSPLGCFYYACSLETPCQESNVGSRCVLWKPGGQHGTHTAETTSKRSTCAAWGLRRFRAAVPSRDALTGNAAGAGAGVSREGVPRAGSGPASSGRNRRLCLDRHVNTVSPQGFIGAPLEECDLEDRLRRPRGRFSRRRSWHSRAVRFGTQAVCPSTTSYWRLARPRSAHPHCPIQGQGSL